MVRTTSNSLKRVNSSTDLPLFENYFLSQVVDFIEVFSLMQKTNEEFLQQSPPAKQGLEGLIRSLKSRNFYYTTRIAVDGTTAHDMERKLNPASFKKTSSGYINAKKWRGYRDKLCVPRVGTVEKAERVAGCSLENELSMVLWEALDIQRPLDAENKLRRLSPSVRRKAEKAIAALDKLIANPKKDSLTFSNYYCSWIYGQLPLSLSSITFMTILYRYAITKECEELTGLLEEELVNQLMLLSVELQQRGILHPMVHVFLEHIFPLNPSSKRNQSPLELAKSAIFLNLLMFAAPDLKEKAKVDFKDRQYAMEGFLMGDFGLWPSQALYCMRESRGKQPEEENTCQRARVTDRTKKSWDSVAKILLDGYRPSTISPGELTEKLNLKDFALLKSETKAQLQQTDHHSSPSANWWSNGPPRAESCTMDLAQLLKKEWPSL